MKYPQKKVRLMRVYPTGLKNPNYKTGLAVSGRRSSLYTSWQNMKARCLNTKHPKYNRYGGRGITICPDWIEIKSFADWALSNGWAEGLQIDRIDNDGNYDPSNCKWVTISFNSRKKCTTKLTFEQAQMIRMKVAAGDREVDVAREFGVNGGTVWFIVRNFTHVAEGECSKRKRQYANDNKKSAK